MKGKDNRGFIVDILTSSIAKYYKEVVGQGPKQIKVQIIDDLIIIRLLLYKTGLIKYLSRPGEAYDQIRRNLFDDAREKFVRFVEEVAECAVKAVYYDNKVVDQETIVVLLCDQQISL